MNERTSDHFTYYSWLWMQARNKNIIKACMPCTKHNMSILNCACLIFMWHGSCHTLSTLLRLSLHLRTALVFIALSIVHSENFHSDFIAPSVSLGDSLWAHKEPQFIEPSDNSTTIFIFIRYETVKIDFRCGLTTCIKRIEILNNTILINAIRIRIFIFFILSFEEKSASANVQKYCIELHGFQTRTLNNLKFNEYLSQTNSNDNIIHCD